jgi:tellurite resistance protein TehA-like permease
LGDPRGLAINSVRYQSAFKFKAKADGEPSRQAMRWGGKDFPMIGLLIGLIVFAVVVYILWIILNMIPMPQPIKLIVTLVFALICLIALLQYMPLGVGLPHGRFG